MIILKRNPPRSGSAKFCTERRVANALKSLSAPNGYVIGIHGPWGSGKSTFINFVLSHIEKHNQETPGKTIQWIDFRPWMVPDQQDLIASFFKLISEEIDPERSKRVSRWKQLLGLARNSIDPLSSSAATLALTVDPSGVTSGLVRTVGKKSLGTLLKSFLEEPSIQAAYEHFFEMLAASKKKIVVAIDDIDRLSTDDLVSIFGMVKSIGRLPNVIYILSYDRAIVGSALASTYPREHPSFLEKIVQQEIDLPLPSKPDLLEILDQETAFLLASSPNGPRWTLLVRDGIRRWIQSPRDVLRLANAVKFSAPALQGEIDPQDLIIVEGLRLFEIKSFDWLRANRDVLFEKVALPFALTI